MHPEETGQSVDSAPSTLSGQQTTVAASRGSLVAGVCELGWQSVHRCLRHSCWADCLDGSISEGQYGRSVQLGQPDLFLRS